MAELRATPYANPLTGLSNDAIQGLLAFMQDKRRTQQLQGLGNLLESTGIPKTVERAAYAESPRGLLDALTNVNRANVPFLKPETAEAAMTLAPIAAPVNKALMQATKGLPVGASIKNVGKDLSAIQIGDRTIPVTINRIDKKSGGELVNVNPTAFDEAFSKTSWQYVGEKGKEGISGRYEKFENFLKDAKSIEASNVSVNKDGGIVFGDGRHRYAVLRDMGLDELPIVMDKESIKNAKKFGYLADTKASLPVEEQPMQGLLDIAKRDASDIFGAGAQRIKYTDPRSGGSIDVLARPDNTASVLGLEVPETFRGQGIGGLLQSRVLQEFPDMQGQVSSKAAATTAYRLGRRPPNMPDATLDDVYKMIDENSSVNLVSPQMQQRIAPTLETEEDKLLRSLLE